ncbi:MAG: lipid-A-disaccharide synthase-related protein [Coleofasciculus sp. B1-GNL1-01]|uniref:lipid-A-disaccharide synthase-related protein n=1 Tax=Coleofasciculus sp. B1-GNL1-01 TaxID=3068484 RepID=UPI0032FE069F
MQLLCISNGHGEDVIAVRILQELNASPDAPELAALPLVGEGAAYRQLDIPIVGPVQTMPSGGFIYMEGRHLLRDVQSGLLKLTWAQLKAVRRWAKRGGVILAVGDIVPLLFAWLSGAPYVFVGTAKSEYYLRDEAGWLPNRKRREGWSGSVYLPWERWLMSRKRCKAVFPRDKLTTEILQKWSIPALDLGNPMMDGIEPEQPEPIFYEPDAEQKEMQRPLVVALLPGSRMPEAYQNWQKIALAANGLLEAYPERSVVFLGAIAPALSLEPLQETLIGYGWCQQPLEAINMNLKLNDPSAIAFTQKNGILILTQDDYTLCLLKADCCIAMAGTATEQFVGLGKPAIAIPGTGPQYTPAFAEAQTRLLGPSLILVEQPDRVAEVLQQLLRDPDRLQLIAENGRRRMGQSGAARRIADCLMERFEK